MNIKERLDNSCGATILFVGDSITGDQSFMYPYRVAELLAARYPDAKVVFASLDPPSSGSVINTTVQNGSGQTIKIVRDGIPGATAVSRSAQIAGIYYYPIHYTSIFLGVNDAVNYHTPPTYTPENYMLHLSHLGRYARDSFAAEVAIIPLAWSEFSPSPVMSHYAACARRVARKEGFKIIDARQIFEDHYTGTGNAGQGSWFSDPNDPTHFGREGHYAIADEFMCINGW